MRTKQVFARKGGLKVLKSAGGTAELRSTNSNALSGLEGLDEETLLSLAIDAPVQLTPSPENNSLILESSPTPSSKIRVSDEVLEATFKRLGFGPPNDLSNFPVSPSPTPANSETSTAGLSNREEYAPTAGAPVLTAEKKGSTMDAPGTDDSDTYSQIFGLFQQIAQRTGHSVHSLILEWALLHAHTALAKGRVHDHLSNTMMARQEVFEEEVNKVIKLVSFFFRSTSLVIDYDLSGY